MRGRCAVSVVRDRTVDLRGLPAAARAAAEALLSAAAADCSVLSDLEGEAETAAFETEFAATAGTALALAVSSGTAALHVALLACDIGPGDEVIVSPYGWGQTVGAVLAVGAVPVFADIVPDTGNLDPEAVRAWIGPRTRAVLVTHMHGCPADMVHLRELCRRESLALLADAAQALGADLQGAPIAAWADVTCFSFGRGKLISTGEGGALATDDADIYERAVLVSQHPLRGLRTIEDRRLRASVGEFGLTYRLSPLLAVIGQAQLATLPARLARRRSAAARRDRQLIGVARILPPCNPPGARHAYYRYVARWTGPAGERDDLVERLGAAGIVAAVGPVPLPLNHRIPFARSTGGWYPRAFRPRDTHPSWRLDSCPNALSRCAREDVAVALEEPGIPRSVRRSYAPMHRATPPRCRPASDDPDWRGCRKREV